MRLSPGPAPALGSETLRVGAGILVVTSFGSDTPLLSYPETRGADPSVHMASLPGYRSFAAYLDFH